MVLIFAAINAPNIFVGPRIADLGGDGLEIALAIAAGTIFEVPAFLAIGTVLRVLGTRGTFALGIAMLTVSGVYSAVVPEPSLVILGRLLSGSGYAWTVLPTMAAMAAAGGPRERAALTSLHYASSAVGSLAIALVGLPLVEAGEGSGAILVVTALLAPIGALLAIVRWPAPYQARPEPVASTAV